MDYRGFQLNLRCLIFNCIILPVNLLHEKPERGLCDLLLRLLYRYNRWMKQRIEQPVTKPSHDNIF